MGKLFLLRLSGSKIYCCKICKIHLGSADDCMSRGFRGSKGTAYLFSKTVNIYTTNQTREETFTTGRHVVADIFCSSCNLMLGWQYIKAHESSQKYKEGKYILDKVSIIRHEKWPRRRQNEFDEEEDDADDDDVCLDEQSDNDETVGEQMIAISWDSPLNLDASIPLLHNQSNSSLLSTHHHHHHHHHHQDDHDQRLLNSLLYQIGGGRRIAANNNTDYLTADEESEDQELINVNLNTNHYH